MTEKKSIEKVINHPQFKKGYDMIDHIYFKYKDNTVTLTATTNKNYKGEGKVLQPIIENISLAYKLTGYQSPTIHRIIIEIYNKRGKKLLTDTMTC